MYIFFICRQTPVGYIREYTTQNLTIWLNKGFRDKMLVILLRKTTNYVCEKCSKSFKQKGHYEVHKKRKTPCKKPDFEKLIEQKVQEALLQHGIDTSETIASPIASTEVEPQTNLLSQNKTTQIVLQTSEAEQELKNDYVYQTMLTCIGNKRKLVSNIKTIADSVREKVNKQKLNIVDGFAGSTVVSRELSYMANDLHVNDMELYSYLMAQCFLKQPSSKDQIQIQNHISKMNCIAETGPFTPGIICKLYAPKETKNIQEGERCFYTRENALIIDTLRGYIDKEVEPRLKQYCLVPLLTKASIHTNTAGVFKGFYKNGNVGCFGGKGEFALSRIMKPIRLEMPIWNDEEYKAFTYREDINTLVKKLPNNIDLIYLDPPYNQHPYGSNYFMLNVIAKNEEPHDISKVSGIPADWQKSAYNTHKIAVESMTSLLHDCLEKSKYVLLSYNNEGIIKEDEWATIFDANYDVQKYEIVYDTFKGSRNLKNRSNKVIEIMYLISKNQ